MKRPELLFVGSHNTKPDPAPRVGIGVYAFDDATGAATHLSTTSDVDNPSFLAIDPENLLIYATSEVAERQEGSVRVYALDPESGQLAYIEDQSTLGSLPCHISFDRTGNFLFAVNFDRAIDGDYPGQALAILPTRGRTGLAPATAARKHKGSGQLRPFQEIPHAHCALVSHDNRFVLVTDLGTDAIVSYPFDQVTGGLGVASDICAMPPGSGPRHLIFSPDGNTAYVSNELNSTVATLAYERQTGRMTVRQVISSLPEGFVGDNYPADLHLSADHRFLYVSNRGHDSIAIFQVDGRVPRLVDHVPTGGAWPRSFAISRSGKFLVVANQRSDQLVTFAIDPDNRIRLCKAATMRVKEPLFATFA